MKSKENQSRNVIQPNFEAKLIKELGQTGVHSRNYNFYQEVEMNIVLASCACVW